MQATIFNKREKVERSKVGMFYGSVSMKDLEDMSKCLNLFKGNRKPLKIWECVTR